MRDRPDAAGNLSDVDINADAQAGDGDAFDGPSDDRPSPPSRTGLFRGAEGPGARWTTGAVLLVLTAVVALLGWNWYASNNGADEAASTASAGPVLMTADQLKAVAASAGHSVYWAGPRDLATYEVSLVGKDVFVRYLPAGEAVGSTSSHLTVGTYARADAYAELQKAATKAGAKSGQLTGGAFVLVPADTPTSAYFAFEGHDLLMEVYDPTPGEALRLVTSGAVNPIT